MAKPPARHTVDELAALVAQPRRSVATLNAENARLRAELAALRGDDAPPADAADSAEPTEAPVRGKALPRWVSANVVTLARTRSRRTRDSVPGRQRAVPDQQIVHAPQQCSVCARVLGWTYPGSVDTERGRECVDVGSCAPSCRRRRRRNQLSPGIVDAGSGGRSR